MAVTREVVEQMAAATPVVIFSKTYCGFCKKARKLFDELKQTYTSYELDERPDGEEIMDVLAEITGARSVPRIFVNGKSLGGFTDVRDMPVDVLRAKINANN